MRRIYLDYASTTPVDPRVLKAMTPYCSSKYGNPGAMHRYGQEAEAAVDESRQTIADFFGCDFNEILFTGSATESNNLTIRGVVKAARDVEYARHDDMEYVGYRIPHIFHIITSEMEHKSVLETCRDLEQRGEAEVTYLQVTKDGFVRPEDVGRAIKKNTVLVSIICVNNEIGTIQPIQEIARIVKETRDKGNEKRKVLSPTSITPCPIFHTDAVQALNYLDCTVQNLGVDLLTFSGHKIYGPKGIGGLYVKKDTPLVSTITGGNQERGMRSGTENVPSIVGFAKAVEISEKTLGKESARLIKLRDYFIGAILKKVSIAELNGSWENRIANNVNFLFRGISANNLLIALDQAGIAASSGSTCAIKTATPSEVLLAIGRTKEEAKQSIRFTLGRNTTKNDIDYTVSILIKICQSYTRKIGE